MAAYGLSNSSLGGCCAGLPATRPGTALYVWIVGYAPGFYTSSAFPHKRTVSTAINGALILACVQ